MGQNIQEHRMHSLLDGCSFIVPKIPSSTSGEMCKIQGGRDFYKMHPRSPLAQTGLAERQMEQSEGAEVQN